MNTLIILIPIILSAIVQTGHGNELHWYTPMVEVIPLHGAPAGWKGATNCWPPVYSGVVYINPKVPEDERLAVLVHELIHLANNCHGSEHDTEMATMDILAFLLQKDIISDDILKRFISMKIEGCYDPASLPGWIVEEYYCKPISTMMTGDITNYPYLLQALEDIGIREEPNNGRK